MIIGRRLNYTPVFFVKTPDTEPWKRIWGASRVDDGWAFPAYYPFGALVWQDFQVLGINGPFDSDANLNLIELSLAAENDIKIREAYAAGQWPEMPMPSGFDYRLAPYRHQVYGIGRCRYRWREWLLWEMGTGKTKTIIETLRTLRREERFHRALVLAPTIVLSNWIREVELHAGDEFRIFHWNSQTKANFQGEDVVLISHAGARIEFEFNTHINEGVKFGIKENREAFYEKLRSRRGKTYGDQVKVACERQLETGIVQLQSALLDLDYDVFIGDESHAFGDFDSGQTQAAIQLSSKAGRRYLLSGTAADKPQKLYPQLRILAPGLMKMSYSDFCTRHLSHSPTKKHLITGYRFVNELNTRVAMVASRMKKSDCLDLPPVTFVDIPYNVGPKQRIRYNEIIEEFAATLDPEMTKVLREAITNEEEFFNHQVQVQDSAVLLMKHGAMSLLKLRQILSGFLILDKDKTVCDGCEHMMNCVAEGIEPHTPNCLVYPKGETRKILRDMENPKKELFEALLEQILSSDETNKVLVWADFWPELDDVEAACKKLKVGYLRVDGRNTHLAGPMVIRFFNDPDIRVWVSQTSAGIGINLTPANYSIYYSLTWNWTTYRQSLERNNRPGQTRAMTVYRLLAQGTLDGFLAKVLEHKDRVAFTLLEQITCATCLEDTRARCLLTDSRPFRGQCSFQPHLSRPVAKAETI